MTVATKKSVRELALENPAATRVFEKLGIDYCCSGNKSLEEACRAANLNIDQVLDSLEKADQVVPAMQKRSRLAGRAARGPDRAHQQHSPPIHTRRDCPPRPPFREGLLCPWQEPSRTIRDSRGIPRPRAGIERALDEGRDDPVSLHSKDGSGPDGQATDPARTIRLGPKSSFDDGT